MTVEKQSDTERHSKTDYLTLPNNSQVKLEGIQFAGYFTEEIPETQSYQFSSSGNIQTFLSSERFTGAASRVSLKAGKEILLE